MKKESVIRILISVAIVAVLVMLWAKRSDLAYNVAQQRDILLGRYTVDHTVTLVIATPVLLLILLGLWKKPKDKDKLEKMKSTFKIIAMTMSIIISLIFMDVAMRVMKRDRYVKDGATYHRPPNQVYKGTYRDRPEAAFSYPKKSTGYPDVKYTLTVDSQGFRNLQEPADCDWLILGDSFAEGSQVSDEQNWPVLLGQVRDKQIYNLGMSGGTPVTYLETLEKFGIQKKPEAAIYLLYEGNDFRDSNFVDHKLEAPEKDTLFDIVYKASPLRLFFKDSLIRMLGPVGAKRFYGDPACNDPSHPMYPVAWLPLQVPAGTGHFYTFDLKRVLQHFISEKDFKKTLAGTESLRLLGEAKALCDQHNIRLIVAYAPDKPHILMDQVTAQVPAEQLYAFMDMKAKELPPVSELTEALNQAVDMHVNLIRQFCDQQQIEFVDLTEPLRKATAEGVQAYFTYDQHWTPDGHKVVADYLAEVIQ